MFEYEDISEVEDSQVPSVIATQFNQLTLIEENVQNAVNQAAIAKSKASAAQISVGLFKKKEAIELLQDATKGLAEAQISATEAQKIFFDYQTRLAEMMKFLLGLGIQNMAMNRSVVRELELKLRGASEEEISDLARQELKNVILQLKAQEDMMKKQEFLTQKAKEHAVAIREIDYSIQGIDQQIEELEQTDDQQNQQIARISERLVAHEKGLTQQKKKDDEHDKRIGEHTEKLTEHDITLENHEKKSKELEKLFAEQDAEGQEQDQKIIANAAAIKTIGILLDQYKSQQREKNQTLEKGISELSQAISCELSELRASVLESHEALRNTVQILATETDTRYSTVISEMDQLEQGLSSEIGEVAETAKNNEIALNDHFQAENAELHTIIASLTDRLKEIQAATTKKLIAISAISFLSLLLSILQICGII